LTLPAFVFIVPAVPRIRMGISVLRAASRRHLAWLLWLAMLLPLAQIGAASHALSHLFAPTGTEQLEQQDGKQALPHHDCALCLLASIVGTGSPLPKALHLSLQAPAAHAVPLHAARGLSPGPLARAYLSRAPPSLPH
jgi:hypothetical protein